MRTHLRRASVSLLVLAAVGALFLTAIFAGPKYSQMSLWATTRVPKLQDKNEISKQLERGSGRDLIIVFYSAKHDPFQEYVYNGADFASAPVLWARSLGPASDAELVKMYPGRNAWTYYPDQKLLKPYVAGQ